MTIPGDKPVKKIADNSRDNHQGIEEFPATPQVPEDAKDSRRAQVMPPRFLIHNCIKLIARQPGFMQHLPALLRLQRHKTKQVLSVALSDETYLTVTEVTAAVI